MGLCLPICLLLEHFLLIHLHPRNAQPGLPVPLAPQLGILYLGASLSTLLGSHLVNTLTLNLLAAYQEAHSPRAL